MVTQVGIGWIGLFACLLLASFPLHAQESGSYDVFLPPDHLLRRQLDEAQAAIDDEQYNTAVQLLGELLTGKPSASADELPRDIEDYFMEPAQEGGAQRSLKSEARQMLAGLPKRGLDLYQLLYGREAELLLQQALVRGDEELLTEVTRKYFYTESGYQAALLLGRIHLSRGRPLAAALALRQVHDLSARECHEPDLSLLLSASWMLADKPERARDVLLSLREKHARTPLTIGNTEVSLFREDEEPLDWLRKTLGQVDLGVGQDTDQWLLFRGNATRNAPTDGGAPLGQVLWSVPTPNEKRHQLAIKAEQEQYIKQRAPALPGLHPLVVRYPGLSNGTGETAPRDIVITRTQRRLLAVDFKTGQRIWFYPHSEQRPMASLAAPPSKADTPQLVKLKQRTWMDTPYGQTSSDGKRVYFIYDLGLADRVGPSHVVAPGGMVHRNPDSPQSHNVLMALDLQREGSKVWQVGDVDGCHEPKLAGAFFLGAPLPLMDRLFALAEVKGDIRLVVLDPKTGALQWQQQLCGVDNQAILDDGVRRLGGASPSFSEGVLVCPTSAGAVVAVDVAKRSLLWGYQYLNVPREHRINGAFFQVTSGSRKAKQPGQAWADSTVTIVGDKVLITPVEHGEIICLDLLRGTLRKEADGKDKPLWRRLRDDGLYVGCIHNGNAVIVGKHSVVAVDIETGKDTWRASLPGTPKAMPSGRGFASGDTYFLPLTSRELVQIDLRGGRLIDVTPTRGILGNLICYRDTVISQGTTEMASFYQRDALGRVVEKALAENPDDAWALARKAELLIKDGKHAEALDSLRRSHKLQADDGTKALLVNTLLGALEDDFAANQKLAVEVESLIDRPDQRSAFLRLMAVGLQDVGELDASFAFFLKIIDDAALGGSAAQGDAQVLQQVNDALQVHSSRWIRARLSTVLRRVTPRQLAAMNATIEARLQAALRAESMAALREHIEYFGEHETAATARLVLAGKLWKAGELLEAELLLGELSRLDHREEVAATATAQLARLLGDAGHVEEAATVYRQLGERFADIDCGHGKTGREVLDALPAESLAAVALTQQPDWPLGRVAVTRHDQGDEEAPTLGYSNYRRLYPAHIDCRRGVQPEGMRIVLAHNRKAFFREGTGQQPLGTQLDGNSTSRFFTSNYGVTHAKLSGHLALLSLGYELFAIDLLRMTSNSSRRVLWSKSLASPSVGGASSRQHTVPKLRNNPWGGHEYFAGNSAGNPIAGFTAPLHQGVVYRRWEQLICFDPLRPERVHWVRDGIKNGAHVFGDAKVIGVVNPGASQASLYSALDGRDLGTGDLGNPRGTWGTVGRRVLRWNQTDDGVTVAMLDLWDANAGKLRENPVLWSHAFAGGAKGTRVEQDELAVLQTDGSFTLISVESGKVRFRTKLEPEERLTMVHVLRGVDEYIVVANRSAGDAPEGTALQPVPGGYGPRGQFSPLIEGRVYALARETGESLWHTPAVIDHFGLPLKQPTQLPMVTFMRNISPDPDDPTREWKTEVVCLDKRDGRIVLHEKEIEGMTEVYRIEGDPRQFSVDLLLSRASFTLQWTNAPRPPAPSAQLDSAFEPSP